MEPLTPEIINTIAKVVRLFPVKIKVTGKGASKYNNIIMNKKYRERLLKKGIGIECDEAGAPLEYVYTFSWTIYLDADDMSVEHPWGRLYGLEELE